MVVQAFLVIDKTSKLLILNTPFMAAIWFQAEYNIKGAIKIIFINPQNGRQIIFARISHLSRRNKKLSNISNNK